MHVAGKVAIIMLIMLNNMNNWIWNNEMEDANKLGMQAFHTWQDWFQA